MTFWSCYIEFDADKQIVFDLYSGHTFLTLNKTVYLKKIHISSLCMQDYIQSCIQKKCTWLSIWSDIVTYMYYQWVYQIN